MLYDDLVKNIDKIKEFNAKVHESLKQENISIQYLALLNSELHSLSKYFNTESSKNYINSNFNQIDNPDLDYQTESILYNCLHQVISENANLDIAYIQKISHLKAFELVKDTGENENVVIIGANGSGKSSFSRNISTVLGKSIVIIFAQKIFQYRRLQQIPIQKHHGILLGFKKRMLFQRLYTWNCLEVNKKYYSAKGTIILHMIVNCMLHYSLILQLSQ